MIAPQGKRKLEQFLAVLMDEQGGAGLSSRMIVLVADARAQWAELDRRIAAFDTEFVRWVKENEEARRLTTIPGVGPIVASALVAAVGRAESFDHGRDLAAWLGLVPRQFTTGGKPKLLGISKRGNTYLRRQLIHGARAALPYVAERDTPLGRSVKGLMSRTHRNVVVVALANKLARIACAKAVIGSAWTPMTSMRQSKLRQAFLGRRGPRLVVCRVRRRPVAYWLKATPDRREIMICPRRVGDAGRFKRDVSLRL